LDEIEGIVDRRCAHVDKSAEQQGEPAPQQAPLQRPRLGAPREQVVLDNVGLWAPGQAGVERVDERVEYRDVFGSQVGGTSQD
jgi:hypothetical protein